MRKIIFFITTFLILSNSSAQVDPSIDWKVLEEDHAVWIYNSKHKALVYQYSKNFKRLFPMIQQLFKEVPSKTTFVISDYTDRPNGSATVFPYPLVTIYPVIPLPNSPIGETDDSFYEILAHEYTHILNLAPVHGGMRGLSWIFGSIVRPNSYLPRWYSEGLAVFTESYFTVHGGRLRSQNFEGMARALSKERSWNQFPIDTLNDFEPDWMGGRRAYLLGGALIYEAAQTHGIDKIYDLNQSYSRRIPYFINAPAEDKTTRDYAELLNDTYSHMQSKADEQIKIIESAPVTKGKEITGQGYHNYRPVFSPDGTYLAYIYRDPQTPSAIQLIKRTPDLAMEKTPATQIVFAVEINDLAWSNSSQKLAYNTVETFKRFYEFSDIRIYDVATQTSEKITSGARAGDLTFSPDDKMIYFVQNITGAKQLSRIDLSSKKIKVLYTPSRLGSHLYSLIAQGDQLFFIEQIAEKRSLKVWNNTTQQVSMVADDVPVTHLRKTLLGVLVTSSQSGVDNLYLAPELNSSLEFKKLRPITNSVTRILDGDIDPQDKSLYYSEQTDHGFYVFTQTEAEWNKITTAPQVKPLLEIPTPVKTDGITDTTTVATEQKMVAQEEDFSPGPYMWPRYWMPFANVLDGGVSFSASTGASDPLGKNTYSLMAEWDTLTKKTGLTASYVNTSTPLELSATASHVYRYLYGSKSTLSDTSASVGASYDIPFLLKNWTLGLSWKTSETEFPFLTVRRSGPAASLGFSNAFQRGYQISPESGITTSLTHQKYIESLGNIGYDKTNLNLKTYFSKWLPEHHVLFAQLNATYAPQLKNGYLYTTTLNGNFFNNQLIAPFLVRGYTSGSILGNNMLAANLEYRFPIARVFRGWNTVPFFIKRIHGAFVGDAVSFDGARYSVLKDLQSTTSSYVPERFGNHWFTGYGAELNIDCTMGYYLPVTFSFGIYRGANRDLATEDLSYFFVFRL